MIKKNSKQPQKDLFKQVARELNCDENEKNFDEKLKKITKKISKTEKSK